MVAICCGLFLLLFAALSCCKGRFLFLNYTKATTRSWVPVIVGHPNLSVIYMFDVFGGRKCFYGYLLYITNNHHQSNSHLCRGRRPAYVSCCRCVDIVPLLS